MSHLHIPDGVLPPWLWISGLGIALVVLFASARATRDATRQSIAYRGALGGVVLLAMAIELPLGPIEYHLSLVGPIGVLIGLADDAEARGRLVAFEQGLEREGWSLGQDLSIEYRHAEGDAARMQAFAEELVEIKPDCIVGHSTPVVTALMHATRTIPIVFVSVSDPIGSGFIASLARPGGNITGSPPCTQASQENMFRC